MEKRHLRLIFGLLVCLSLAVYFKSPSLETHDIKALLRHLPSIFYPTENSPLLSTVRTNQSRLQPSKTFRLQTTEKLRLQPTNNSRFRPTEKTQFHPTRKTYQPTDKSQLDPIESSHIKPTINSRVQPIEEIAKPVPLKEQCNARNQLVFIKTHKTASTTLQLIVQMYGYYRNLSFLFNAKDNTTGHIRHIKINTSSQATLLPPLSVDKGDYLNYRNYDMSAIHIKYQRPFLDAFMKNNTKYISIIRDPVMQFESAFVFFGYVNGVKGKTTDAKINEWLKKPKPKSRFVNNNQMYDLGMDIKHFRNKTKVDLYIDKLSREFDLVLLAEYFDESLLLLRKMMCWSFDDILYIKQNSRPSTSKLSNTVKDKIRQWNVADVMLYAHFNHTFWGKIDEYGAQFQTDLEYFRHKQHDLFESCVLGTTLQKVKSRSKISRVAYKVSSNASDYCVLMTDKDIVFRRLWKRQMGEIVLSDASNSNQNKTKRQYEPMDKDIKIKSQSKDELKTVLEKISDNIMQGRKKQTTPKTNYPFLSKTIAMIA